MKNLFNRVCMMISFVITLTLLYPEAVSAQEGAFTLSGVVQGSDGSSLIGATIVEKGTTNGAVAGVDGEYTIKLSKKGAVVIVSYIGYTTEELTADNPILNVELADESNILDEVTVVAYGTMKKRDITGSVSSISSKTIEKKMATNVFEALQGQAAGVQIMSGSGQPGETSSVKIRGISTFSGAGVQPLYVVDGAPMDDIDAINPSDIASIEVLKDAASAAMYGSRSANGVILITTKVGEAFKPRIDFKYNRSWGELSHKLPQANRDDRRLYDLKRRQYFLDNNIGNPDESFMVIQDSLNSFFNVDNDFQDLIFKWAQKDQVDISVSGGTDKIKYYATTGLLNETGIVPNTNFMRLSARINADYQANDWLKMVSRISTSYSQKNGVNEGMLMSSMLSRRPYFNLYYPDGSLVGVFQGQKNPLAQVLHAKDESEYYKTNIYQAFDIKILKDLKFQSSINANAYLTKRTKMTPSILQDEWQTGNSGSYADWFNWNWLNENYFTYKTSWGDHNFSALLGFSAQQWRGETATLAGINSSTDYISSMNSFSSNLILNETGTWESNHSMASVFSRVTYDYNGTYLFNVNVRRDGSSRFSKENRWGNFPSVSAAWRFSDENFMKFTRKILSDAKIRVSYGLTGNEQIGNYEYMYSYSPGSIYDGIGGVYPSRIAVDNLQWEETKQLNVGLDLTLFKGRLTIVGDYYDKYTNGLLASYELPKESGFNSMRTNVGEMRNRGVELAIAGDLIRTKDFTWNASFNISRNYNSIEKLSGGKPYLEGGLWWLEEGGRVGDFYGYKQNGIFQYDESNAFASGSWDQLTPIFESGKFSHYTHNGAIYNGEVLQKKLANGDPFRGGDVNWEESANSRNGVIDDNDRSVIGNALPTFTGGLNTSVAYKGWSLYLSFYYSFGADIYNAAEHTRNSFKYSSTTPSPDVINNIWLEQGDIAKYPRPHNDEFNNARYANSFYLEDGSYIKLQNVRFAYQFPDEWTKSLKVKNASLYAYVNNALTWTNYTGYDPEFSSNNPLQIGKDTYRYPKNREYGLGLSVNF